MSIKKTPEELLEGINRLISLTEYYKEGITEDVNILDSHALRSQACIIDKINTLEEALTLFGINSYEYRNNKVSLKEINKN